MAIDGRSGYDLKDSEEKRDDDTDDNITTSPNSRFFSVGSLIALLLCGSALALAHHFFNSYLNEKSINSASKELPSIFRNQNYVNFIGTAIAHGSRIFFAMVVAITLTQLLWHAIRSRSLTIEQLDALVNCGRSPFTATTLRAGSASVPVLGAALVASAMSLLVIVTPGSLTVNVDFQRFGPCEVSNIPSTIDSSCSALDITMRTTSLNVLSSNTYTAPYPLDPAKACKVGSTACSYDIEIHGIGMNCTDVTSETDLSTILHPKFPPKGAPYLVWNATLIGPFLLRTLTQDLVKGSVQATECTSHNTTYHTKVSTDGTSAIVRVLNTTFGEPLGSLQGTPFISSYGQNALNYLTGNIYAGADGYAFGDDILFVPMQVSSLLVATADGNHTFSDDIQHFLTSYAQNMTISLLSGNVNYCFSNDTSTNLQIVNSTCASTFSVFAYDPPRLLVTYGVGLGLALLGALAACWLIMRHGEETKILLAQMLKIGLNGELIRASGRLQCNTLVRYKGSSQSGPTGRLVPVSEEDGSTEGLMDFSTKEPAGADEIQLAYSIMPRKKGSWRIVGSVRGRTIIFLLSALVCMVLHHLYFHYLNGKTPESHISRSSWLTNHSVVSFIGLALAYICQTFLAATIALSAVQQFWRTIRSSAHSVSQIDSLMNIQYTAFSPSTFRALRPSASLLCAMAILATSTSLLSIFALGSIKVSSDYEFSKACTVLTPMNLSAATTPNVGPVDSIDSIVQNSSYESPIIASLSSSTYWPPRILFELDRDSGCSYDLQFIAPGLECKDVTASGNQSAFISPLPEILGQIQSNLYSATIWPQDDNLTLDTYIQTWDLKNAAYSATNCTGVLRSYSVVVSKTQTSSSIEVVDSTIDSVIHASFSQLTTFPDVYLWNLMWALQRTQIYRDVLFNIDKSQTFSVIATSTMGGIAAFELDGNVTWNGSMPAALERFAQNAALSVLSGGIFALNPDSPALLENATTTCRHTRVAYEYAPMTLFLTYAVAIGVTALCAIVGAVALRRNAVEETMDFSRFLRAILNPGLFSEREHLDAKTLLKADLGMNGELVPVLTEGHELVELPANASMGLSVSEDDRFEEYLIDVQNRPKIS